MSGAGVEGNGALPINDEALSKAFGKILEHPELISMVAGVLGGDKSDQAGEKDTAVSAQSEQGRAPVGQESVPTGSSQGVSTDALASIMPMLGKLSSIGAGGDGFKHEPLLCALKPYLNEHRCDTVDLIIRMSKISTIIGGMR